MEIILSCWQVIFMHKGFWGWYFKCQSGDKTFAVIPAIHKDKSEKSCSIQLITESGSWNVCYPFYVCSKSRSAVAIAGSQFGRHGIHLDIHTTELTAVGDVSFDGLTPINYDIMGPFCLVPFMECRHSVVSMKHRVTGEISINGISYVFNNGTGYWEGDRGRSFPKEYAWTQCVFQNGSLMLSVADIPVGRRSFTGIIGVILIDGKEYRLATYLGAKAARIQGGEIIIKQGSMIFKAKQLENTAQNLRAPQAGSMARTIRENASCRAYYEFRSDEHTILALETPNASFEYEYPN